VNKAPSKQEEPDDLLEVTTYGDLAEGNRKFITSGGKDREKFWKGESKKWEQVKRR
jgi:hypothetical protein